MDYIKLYHTKEMLSEAGYEITFSDLFSAEAHIVAIKGDNHEVFCEARDGVIHTELNFEAIDIRELL